MKKKTIIFAFVGIAIILLSIWCFAYRPVFSGDYAIENTEWGGFGDFFWGLGTMLLTALNVYLMYRINSTIEYNRRTKDVFEIQKEIINEYKSLRDKCLIRESSDVFKYDPNYIAPMESFIRELRRYVNIFPFITDSEKSRSLNVLQERLRLLQDQSNLDRWRKEHDKSEWETFNCVMYSHSEWILGYMTKDWYEKVNESLQNTY